jgi:hypothetical protein
METTEILDFKDNVDSWIKKINKEVANFQDMPVLIEENIDNTQHNYELVKQLRDEFDDLKKEVKLLRTIQLMFLKKYNEEKKN